MADDKQQIKPFLRVFNADLVGAKPINMALLKIKGVGVAVADSVCKITGLDKNTKTGTLTDEQVKKLEDAILRKTPKWMWNRRREFYTGEVRHLVGADLKFESDNDIKRVRKLKTFKGMRHSSGLPVRGQRTRAHFRHGKAVGVQKTKA